MKIISIPTPEPRGMKRPPWWLTWWMPTGTIVEHRGRRWEKVMMGAGDQVWRGWVLVKSTPMPKTPPKGGSGGSYATRRQQPVSRRVDPTVRDVPPQPPKPNAGWTKKGRRT